MRQLMDMYLDANSSKKISDFENQSLVELIIEFGKEKIKLIKKILKLDKIQLQI